jgi:hypothetical protein
MATQATPQGGPAPAGAGETTHPAVRDYTLVCLVALLVMAVVLARWAAWGEWWWTLVPVLVGSVALLGRWATGPPLVLLSVAGLYLADLRWGHSFGSLHLWASDETSDLLLAVALLAYTAGHYRLQALTVRAVPDDRRGPGGARAPVRHWFLPAPPGRSPERVRPGEVLGLLLSLPVFAALAYLAWGWLIQTEVFPMLSLPRAPVQDRTRNPDARVWEAVLVVWVFAGCLAAAGAVLGYLRWRRVSPEEAVGYLQDQLWRQTRREQRRANRWVAWGRLRRQRREEGR